MGWERNAKSQFFLNRVVWQLESHQKVTHVPSMLEAEESGPAIALQDKSPRLARPLAHGLNSWLSPVVRPSHQTTLFGKNWLFTFLLTGLYIDPYTHDIQRASRENFEREALEKNKIDSSIIFTKRLFKFLYSFPLHCQILERFLAKPFFSPYPYLWEGFLVLWEAVRKGPISYWLMLWSSSRIR